MTITPKKPPLSFRVGVTGTRRILPTEKAAIRAEIAQVLGFICRQIGELAQAPASQAVYAQPMDGKRSAELRLVSPLAEGSDRLAAEEALKAGYALHTPLPFSQSEYEKDFPDSVEEFRALLSKADVLELDGTRELANESYREVGRFVVRNCDLLIAVWDGARERGPGGTAEIIRFAINLKVPVWWIDPSGHMAPRFVDLPQALTTAHSDDAGTANHELCRYIKSAVAPPKIADTERPGVFGWLAHILSRTLRNDASPLDEYLNETDLQTRGIWRTYSTVMKSLVPKTAGISPAKTSYIASSSENSWWLEYFQPADRLSEAYGNRYRSSYVLIAALAIIVSASAVGDLLSYDFKILTYVTESVAMTLIAALVLANYYYRWHERWISYRLLAELFRKQAMLWTIGRSLPTQEILLSALTSNDSEDGELSKLSRDTWIAWSFGTVARSAPPLNGPFCVKKEGAAASANALINEQIQYHRWRVISSKAAASSMEKAGQLGLFVVAIITLFRFAAVIVAVFKVGFWAGIHSAGTYSEWLKAVGGVLSALSISFVALRAYTELPLLGQQSSRMIRILKNAQSEMAAVEVDEPAASWQLGRTMNALALSMMQDVTGWMHLFRAKPLEIPDLH